MTEQVVYIVTWRTSAGALRQDEIVSIQYVVDTYRSVQPYLIDIRKRTKNGRLRTLWTPESGWETNNLSEREKGQLKFWGVSI